MISVVLDEVGRILFFFLRYFGMILTFIIENENEIRRNHGDRFKKPMWINHLSFSGSFSVEPI